MTATGPMLRREADCFCRLLCGVPPPPGAIEAYVDAHRYRKALHPANAFQEKLVEHASRGVFFARMTDGYARFFDPEGPLRQKLVLMLAILECSPPTHRLLDAPVAGMFGSVVRLVPYVSRGMVCIILGTLYFTSLRIVSRQFRQ